MSQRQEGNESPVIKSVNDSLVKRIINNTHPFVVIQVLTQSGLLSDQEEVAYSLPFLADSNFSSFNCRIILSSCTKSFQLPELREDCLGPGRGLGQIRQHSQISMHTSLSVPFATKMFPECFFLCSLAAPYVF